MRSINELFREGAYISMRIDSNWMNKIQPKLVEQNILFSCSRMDEYGCVELFITHDDLILLREIMDGFVIDHTQRITLRLADSWAQVEVTVNPDVWMQHASGFDLIQWASCGFGVYSLDSWDFWAWCAAVDPMVAALMRIAHLDDEHLNKRKELVVAVDVDRILLWIKTHRGDAHKAVIDAYHASKKCNN